LPQIATAFLMEPLGFVLIPFLSSKSEADRDRAGWPLLCAIAAVSSIVAVSCYFWSRRSSSHFLRPGWLRPLLRSR
jgi:hypothetical protein